MLQLTNVEWHVILRDNFTGAELCPILQICHKIRCTLQHDTILMMLVKTRQKLIENPSDYIGLDFQKLNKLLRRSFDKLCNGFDMNDHNPDGFKVLESKDYVIAISDAYAFNSNEVSFFKIIAAATYL
jgi:hypothetical protein